MPDLADLHPLLQEALRTGAVPSREELARALGKRVDDIPDLDTDNEEDAANPEDPATAEFGARYHQMVAEKIADWLADQEDRNAGCLADFSDQTVPDDVREYIEEECRHRTEQQWRTLQQRNQPDDDLDDDGPEFPQISTQRLT